MTTHLLDLDELSLSHVLAALPSAQDILNVGQTCKTLHEFVQREDGFHWKLRLKEDWDVSGDAVGVDAPVGGEMGMEGENESGLGVSRRVVPAYKRTYKGLVRQGRGGVLRFRGVFTNGAVDPVGEVGSSHVTNDTVGFFSLTLTRTHSRTHSREQDADITRYWVDHAFKNDLSPYCSVNPRNVDIIAVHLTSSRTTYKRERSDRRFIQTRTAFARAWLRRLQEVTGGNPLFATDPTSDLQSQQFFLALMESFDEGHGMGMTLFMDEESGGGLITEARRLRDDILGRDMGLRNRVVHVDGPSRPNVVVERGVVWRGADAKDADETIEGGELQQCVVDSLLISRRGDLTCPVRCGWVFGGCLDMTGGRDDDYVHVERVLRGSVEGMADPYNDVLGLDMVMGLVRQGLVPPVACVHLFVVDETVGRNGITQEGSAFVEFARDWDESGVWRPIGYFIFGTSWTLGWDSMVHDEEEGEGQGELAADSRRHAALTFRDVPLEDISVIYQDTDDQDDTDDVDDVDESLFFSEMEVNLLKRRLVNSLALKLVECENRMAEDDPHPVPNIDLSKVVVHGRRLDGAGVDAQRARHTHGYNTRFASAAEAESRDDDDDGWRM